MAGNLIEIDLKLTDFGFGLALAGHTNRNRMGTFICGINPKGAAFENGQLKVGDELLKELRIVSVGLLIFYFGGSKGLSPKLYII